VTVSGQSNIAASGLTSALTVAAGNNITLSTSGNTLTIAYTSTTSSSIFATGGDMGTVTLAVTASEDLGATNVVASLSYDLGSVTGAANTISTNEVNVTAPTGNVNTVNLNATGLVSATGNVTGGNILSNGQLSVIGNIVQSAANSFIAHSYNQSITAAGTVQANAYVITATNNQFSTVASGSGAILPAGLPGQIVFVANDGANSLLVYPSVGGSIDQAVANAAITVTAGGMWMGTALGSNVWTTISPDTVATANQTTVTQGNGIVTIGLASSPSVSGNITGGNILVTAALSVGGNITSHAILETATITATAPPAPTNFDIVTQAVQYYTANATANVTLNFRGSSTITANTLLAVGQSTTVALLWTNGASAFYPNLIQIDGSNVTPKWQGGTAVSGGNPSAVDVYSFTIIKTAATPTYVVLGSQTKFA
jgi:hypothetical protein